MWIFRPTIASSFFSLHHQTSPWCYFKLHPFWSWSCIMGMLRCLLACQSPCFWSQRQILTKLSTRRESTVYKSITLNILLCTFLKKGAVFTILVPFEKRLTCVEYFHSVLALCRATWRWWVKVNKEGKLNFIKRIFDLVEWRWCNHCDFFIGLQRLVGRYRCTLQKHSWGHFMCFVFPWSIDFLRVINEFFLVFKATPPRSVFWWPATNACEGACVLAMASLFTREALCLHCYWWSKIEEKLGAAPYCW